MSSDERQEAIWDIILQRKFETVPTLLMNLAFAPEQSMGM